MNRQKNEGNKIKNQGTSVVLIKDKPTVATPKPDCKRFKMNFLKEKENRDKR